ncbi:MULTISPECIES: ATP-binding cassette domain-containing protein [Lacrimispora]|uniref:ABC transporter ATP-binding protein n=1 Tax=Lacrimispora TaxID=2719231 RepID=UPI000BE44FB4|nr:ATP-binding cassette domain-containing protein [Lacrimispora amygdalina]MDK2967776.1 viologen exporter family transport system ATP-binding protein [Lacrimispora sp.]
MKNLVVQDTPALVIDNIIKEYCQWQRSGNVRDIIKNLIRPEKRVVTALDRISLQINKGEFVAYAGANGAGKSTTIKILSGILMPTSGTVSVLGLNPARDRIRLMRRIGVLFGQRTELWWDHPVLSSFEWKKEVWNIPDSTYRRNLEMVTELLDLSDILKTFARELSLGQRMRADIAMLLLHSPELIFLDEPTLGLDVLAKQQMIRFLKKMNQENKTTVVVTSHDMDDLEEMAQRMILINKGKIAFDGNFDQLRNVMGGFYRILLTTKSEVPPLSLPGMKLLKTQNGVHEYELDRNILEIHKVMELLSGYPQILDMEIKKAPIEDVVANLYLSWRK